MQERKKQSFFQGAMILSIAAIIVKLLGAVFKIPLTSILGGHGMGYFSTAYDIYMPVYVISNAGLPVAIAKIVAESVSEKRFRDAKKTLRIANTVFFITGLTGFCIMFFGAKFFVNVFIDNPGAYLAVMAMAPTVFFVCLTSAYKGYYEGLHNMYPTAIAQVVEVVVKLVFGFGLSMIAYKLGMNKCEDASILLEGLINSDAQQGIVNAAIRAININMQYSALELAKLQVYQMAAAGAILGVALGAMGSWFSAFIRHKLRGDGIKKEELDLEQIDTPARKIFKRIIRIAIPIALGSCVGQVTGVIDLVSVYDRLHFAVDEGYDVIKTIYGSAIPDGTKLSEIPNYLNGCYKGMAVTLYNLIPTFTVAFGVSALPAVTTAWAEKNKESLKENVEAVLRMTMLLVLPAGIGLATLSHGILTVLYGARPDEVEIATPLLIFLGIAVIFSATCSPINSMLQAVGRADLPVKIMIGCAALKLLFNYITVGLPSINIRGAAMGTLLCYVLIMSISLFFLLRITKVRINFITVFIKPLISALLCGGSAFVVSYVMMKITSERLATIIAIFAAMIVYVVSLVLIRAISAEDIERLPKGKKLAALYNKIPGIK